MLRNCIVYDKEEIKERKIYVYVEFCRSFEINVEWVLKEYVMKIVKKYLIVYKFKWCCWLINF